MANAVATLLAPDADLPPCDKPIGALYRYWQSIRPSPDRLPGRRNFHPTDVPRLLQWIWLVDVQHKPLRFKYRLVGTAHVDAAGSNPTGRWYDEVHPRFRSSSAYPQFVAVAEQAQVAFYRGPPAYVIDYEQKTIERLILPMAQNGRDVDMLLAITVLDPKP
ncbi:MAG: PAS domain-containing protein [Stellaceae bacterium]